MRLADFIVGNMELIMGEWVAFAATSGPAGKSMDNVALRDHAAEMLQTIVADLQTRQTDAEQTEKSRGRAGVASAGMTTAAEVHGAIRAESGFTLGEMVSEYRALRASVIRLWTRSQGSLTGEDLGDLTRFNEAIDQATAESIIRFMHDLDRSREMFVAVLGHDLRSPLSAIAMSAQFMLERGQLDQPDATLAATTLRSAQRMNRMVGDLLDFTRSRLGTGIPIDRTESDLAIVASHALEEAKAANPQRQYHLHTHGDLRGQWDAPRISQVFSNFLANAAQYGDPAKPITVIAQSTPEEVVLSVHNCGPAIPASQIPRLFDPVKRLRTGEPAAATANLGLGLYIAQRVVAAHGGTVEVRSTEDAGTTFAAHLPH